MRPTFYPHGKGVVSKLFLAEEMTEQETRQQASRDAQAEYGTVAGINLWLSAKAVRKGVFWEVTGRVA